ncbi:indole-3-glycerol phosphate synthase TrpC [Petrotoga sp. 9PWA.NaAc.5.4]|uniref:indole-3-glycerol phosphate synthase TrpC n=1 Tax=Petrotoga sp. 9PWA.NaAc.5.4 TaxID=1434328 RepID=UPI000CB80AD3|nr:indole-3-glycerol phosphate synthase TrpC [Petrotoga sp. 9PWA.NaAc.5.4]PNR93957.1 indole-3-glycerol phosphate synthase [Petrotoga sp. 9PWA.NaAc.5.4]
MYLENIIKTKEEEISKLFEKRNSLKESLKKKNLTLIAEIKKSSPSKGIISKDFDPCKQLNAYIEGGADAISILTDKKYFQGSPEILKNLRNKTTLPILRKDFIINPIQIYESFLLGADVVLLIAKILSKKDIEIFLEISHELRLEAIVEIHDFEDLEKILDTKTEILGINNRNLENFTVDITTTEKILNKLEKLKKRNEFYIVSESGIKDRNDIIYLKNLGVDGVLIGEALMREKDPSEKIKELFPEKEFIKNG